MKLVEKKSSGYPAVRLCGSNKSFEVLRFVGLENAKPGNQSGMLELPELIAYGTSREAAMAAMRLFGVESYEDWTQ